MTETTIKLLTRKILVKAVQTVLRGRVNSELVKVSGVICRHQQHIMSFQARAFPINHIPTSKPEQLTEKMQETEKYQKQSNWLN